MLSFHSFIQYTFYYSVIVFFITLRIEYMTRETADMNCENNKKLGAKRVKGGWKKGSGRGQNTGKKKKFTRKNYLSRWRENQSTNKWRNYLIKLLIQLLGEWPSHVSYPAMHSSASDFKSASLIF